MDYRIRFANKEDSISDALIEKGFAEKVEEDGKTYLRVFLKKMDPVIYATDDRESTLIDIDGNSVKYFHRWGPDDRLSTAISKCFPDDVLDSKRQYSAGYSMNISWYEKNGEDTLKDGTPSEGAIANLSPKLLKDCVDMYQISIPIGENGDKWGTIDVPKDNVKYSVSSFGDKYGIVVLFKKGQEKVTFKNEEVMMDTKDILTKYYNSRKDYRNEMNTSIEINHLPLENITERIGEMGKYFIVKIPCPTEISRNGELSITLQEFNVDEENGDVCIGIKGKSRNARIMTEDGQMVIKEFRNPDIKKYYEQAMMTRERTEIEEDNERDDR